MGMVAIYQVPSTFLAPTRLCRGDDQHDQLAVAYQLVLDNRAVSKATSETPPNISASLSTSPPRSSFTMKEGGVAAPGPAEPQRPVS